MAKETFSEMPESYEKIQYWRRKLDEFLKGLFRYPNLHQVGGEIFSNFQELLNEIKADGFDPLNLIQGSGYLITDFLPELKIRPDHRRRFYETEAENAQLKYLK